MRRLARLLLVRGEHLSREGDFLEAGLHFETAATISEGVGDSLPAADAALEVGRCALLCFHGELLPRLAGRLDNLASEHAASLPIGGLIGLRAWAQILRKAESKPIPLFELIDQRRRARRGASPLESRPAGEVGGVGVGCLLPGLLGPAEAFAGGTAPGEEWRLSEDRRWFVRVIEDPSAAVRIESGERIADLGRRLGCRVLGQIEIVRVVVKVAADRRGYALLRALRDEARELEKKPS